MPRFEDGLTEDELAPLANFTIAHFGGRPGRVTDDDIKKVRSTWGETQMRRTLPGWARRGSAQSPRRINQLVLGDSGRKELGYLRDGPLILNGTYSI
jgi:hypothetical protein